MEKSAISSVSLAAARALRGGVLPHVPPPPAPVSTRVRLTVEAGPRTFPEVVLADPEREDRWRVAMEPASQPGLWTAEILTPQEPTLLIYHFLLADGTQIRERRQLEGQEKAMLRDQSAFHQHALRFSRPPAEEVLIEKPLYGQWKEQDFRLAVYLPQSGPPDWVRGQVFYQIVPDRFARSGETPRRARSYEHEALHLAWDAPPEHPPKARDFYGGNLRGVIDKLDYLAELGVTCLYFTPVFTSPSNHRYDAVDYYQIDPQLGSAEDFRALVAEAGARGMRIMLDAVFNHCSSESIYFKAAQQSVVSPYYRWFHFQRWPDDYLGWVGVKTMPEFVECPEVEAFFFGDEQHHGMRGVAQHWLAYGTAGWRTDVTPWLSGGYWRRFRQAVRRAFPEAFLVAEDWGDASKRLLGDSFDATMNYRFANTLVGWAGGKLNPLELDDRLETLRRDTPPGPFQAQLNLLDSHDTARALTLLDGEPRRLRLAAALQFAYPGAPMIYSGDEVGQQGAYAENSRRAFPWGALDQPEVSDLLDFYRRLVRARRASRALSFGDVQTAWIDPRGGYAFLRHAEEEVVAAVFNSGPTALEAEFPVPGGTPGAWSDLLGSLPGAQVDGEVLRAAIPPLSAAWFRAGE